jgi:hypothetical protein
MPLDNEKNESEADTLAANIRGVDIFIVRGGKVAENLPYSKG